MTKLTNRKSMSIRLTDAQLILLSRAAQREDGASRKSRRFQCKDVTPCISKASITPSKMRPTPIAETKNPTMRVVASIPMGPILRVSFSA